MAPAFTKLVRLSEVTEVQLHATGLEWKMEIGIDKHKWKHNLKEIEIEIGMDTK